MSDSTMVDPATPVTNEPTRRAWWIALVLTMVALVLPVLVTQLPPLTDYPNHLARMLILAHPNDPQLSRYYTPRWAPLPNIAMDLIVPAAMHVLPIYAAGKVMVLLSLLLPTTGAITYSRTLFERRSFWQVLSGLAAYNGLLMAGFLNYEASMGAALWIATGWLRFRDGHPWATAVATAIAASAMFWVHVTGMLFLAALIVPTELAAVRTKLRSGGRGGLVRHAGVLVVVFAPLAILYRISPFSEAGWEMAWLDLQGKLATTRVPFANYIPALDILTAIAVFAVAVLGTRAPWGRRPLATRMTLAVLSLVYALSPFTVRDTGFVDIRFAVMFVFAVFAGLMPGFRSPKTERIIVCGLAALLIVRLSVVEVAWHGAAHGVNQVREVIRDVSPGERVLATDVEPDDNEAWAKRMPFWRSISGFMPSYRHFAALVTIDRDAFWSGEFASRTQQPMSITPDYQRAACVSGDVRSYRLLASLHPEHEHAPCLVGWRSNYDYVLVLNAGGLARPSMLMPNDLSLVRANDMAALYRIIRSNSTLPH